MSDWLGWLRCQAGRAPLAMISVLATEGSAPRGAGTRMLVTANTLVGTIGGGQLEFRAVEQARAILGHAVGAWRVQDYPLGPLLGQCCGGRVRLLVEHVDPGGLGWLADAVEGSVLVTELVAGGVERSVWANAEVPFSSAEPGGEAPPPAHSLKGRGEDRLAVQARSPLPEAGARFVEVVGRYRRALYLFGAGHVGQAIARHAADLPFRLAWFDTRAEFSDVAGVTVVDAERVATCVADAPADAAIVILTHDHGLDYRLTLAALQRAPVAYVGLIGSSTKRARFLARLGRDGIGAPDLARLTCPIGLPGISGKEPDVIAIATLAQLLAL